MGILKRVEPLTDVALETQRDEHGALPADAPCPFQRALGGGAGAHGARGVAVEEAFGLPAGPR